MTSLGTTVGDPAHRAHAGLGVTQARVVRSEWIKLRSVRSWLILFGAAAGVVVAFAALAAAVASGDIAAPVPPGGGGATGGGNPFANSDPTAISLTGTTMAQLLVGVLGVLVFTNEYANGMIRATLAAVPRRLPVLWAKIAVLAGAMFAVMTAACLAAFLIGQVVLGDGANTTLGTDGVLRAVFGAAAYLTGVAVFGLGVGALLRSTAGAIAVVVASLLVIPGLIGLVLPEDWADTLTPYLFSNAGQAMLTVGDSATLLAPGTGAVVFIGWLAVLVAAAAVLLRRRDA